MKKWRVHPNYKGLVISGKYVIAKTKSYGALDTMMYTQENSEQEANAKMISVVPEALELLQQIKLEYVFALGPMYKKSDIGIKLNRILKKAGIK